MGSDRQSPTLLTPLRSPFRYNPHRVSSFAATQIFRRNSSTKNQRSVLIIKIMRSIASLVAVILLFGDCVFTAVVKTQPTVTKGAACYLRLDGEEGVLESPNYPLDYPSNQDCHYDIVRTSSSVCGVRLYIEDLNIPGSIKGGDVCLNDYISVESCVPEGGARFCGSDSGISHHYNFQPGATAIRLLFHSDAVGNGRGFRIRYKMVEDCSSYFFDILPSGIPPNVGSATCFTRISEASGTINTPYHPKNYPENLDCVYQFVRTNPNLCGVRMKTIKFDLQAPMDTPFGGACSDFFHMPSCGFLCGKMEFSWFARYQPGATSLEFHFHSDESIGLSGFLISFEQIYDC